jgi:hypothetical protein
VTEERFWPARLRWRLRGASMWPAFVVLTFLDGLLLHLLPPIGTGVDLIPGIILATFGNLILIGAAAPWLARRIRAHRPVSAPPPAPPEAALEVLTDRVGTALLGAAVVGIVAAGLASRPLVVAETKSDEENAHAVRNYVLHSGDRELIRNIETANTARLSEGYYRTCVARDDRRRYFCLFVDTDKEPTEVVKDPSSEPNSAYKAR